MKFHALSSPFLLFSVWNMILSSIVVHGQHQPYYDNDYGDEDYYQDQAGGGYYYQDEGSNMYTDYVENKAGGYVYIRVMCECRGLVMCVL